MSLLELILSQDLIIITAVLAALPLLAAVSLAAFPLIRQARAKKKARKDQEAAIQANIAQQGSEDVALSSEQQNDTPQPQADEAGAGQAQGEKPQEGEYQTDQLPGEEDQAPDAIQDILSSVFEDEESAALHEVLLKGLSGINASDLLATCNWVADQLRMSNAAASRSAVNIQELTKT